MMNRRFALAALAAFTALAANAAMPAVAQTYRVTDLGSLSGASESTASKVNDKGSVLGRSRFKSGVFTTDRYWLWTPDVENGTTGRMAEFTPLAGFGGAGANDINNVGLIVGSSHLSDTNANGAAVYYISPNAPVNINDLERDTAADPSLAGWFFNVAVAVSDPDATTGAFYVSGDGYYQGGAKVTIVWRMAPGTIAGTYKIISVVPQDPSGSIRALNFYGQGASVVNRQATLLNGNTGQGTSLGYLPGGTSSFANGINDVGNVVGESYTTATGGNRGFFWTPTIPNGTVGTMTALGTLGGTRSSANAINNWSQVVGYSYLKGDRVNHACRFASSGAAQDLNSLEAAGATGLELLWAGAINRGGSIVGAFNTNQGGGAFLLTPLP